jgi:hypothetical protein
MNSPTPAVGQGNTLSGGCPSPADSVTAGMRTVQSDLLERPTYAEFLQALLNLFRLIGLYDHLECAL